VRSIFVHLRRNEPLIATKPSPSLTEAYLSPHGRITIVLRNQSFSLYRFKSVLIVLRYGQGLETQRLKGAVSFFR
jgi:hypothetical protein